MRSERRGFEGRGAGGRRWDKAYAERVSVYLDNNATTQPLPEVAEAVERSLREFWHNPSSVHRPGQAARQQIDLARKQCAELVGTKPRFVTFTGSGTEAIDLAIRGALLAQGRLGGARAKAPGAIITSEIEHTAVRDLARALEREEGVKVHWAAIEPGGVVSAEHIRELLEAHADVALVSVQWANNETGAVQPVREIAALCRARGVVFHTDATQWVGKMAVTGVEEVDLLTYSPHKFHGLKGVGVLVARAGVRTSPLIHGEQELGRRGGTENVPGIVGAGVAARLAANWLESQQAGELAGLRDEFERRVLAGCPGARVNGAVDGAGEPIGTRRLWNTTSIAFPRLEAEALLMLLSERGVCASAGAACSSGSLDPSPVLRAMGIEPEYAHGSVRFSLSRLTTRAEVEEAGGVVAECVRRLRGSMNAVETGQ